MIGNCSLCHHTNSLISHHTDYKKNDTIPVCLKCHREIHADKNHKYYPKNNAIVKSVVIPYNTYEELILCKIDFEIKNDKCVSFAETIGWLIDIAYNETSLKRKHKIKYKWILLKKEEKKELGNMRLLFKKKFGKRIGYSKLIEALISIYEQEKKDEKK